MQGSISVRKPNKNEDWLLVDQEMHGDLNKSKKDMAHFSWND